MANLFADTGIGKHIIRTHHWGIVLPTVEKAEAFMKTFGLQEDYRGHVKAYDADLIFTKHGNGVDAVEFIIPLSGVLTEFNKGKGGIAHVAYLVDDINAVSEEIKAMGYELLEKDHNIKLKGFHKDCGMLIYDLKKQDVNSGGSGCGCSASVLCSHIMKQIDKGILKKVLFVATGALMSPTSSKQGNPIPGIAHAVLLER